MQKIKHYFVLFCILFFSLKLISQENAKSILKEFKDRYISTENYQTDVFYEVYKGHDSKIPHQKSTGVVYKNGNSAYSKIGDVEIIDTKEMHLRVNHDEKAILIANSQQNNTPNQFDLESLFDYLDIDTLEVNPSSWKIVLKAKPITQLPFSSIEITIDKNTFRLKKQVFYYINKIDFSQNVKQSEFDSAKLVVKYKNYKTKNFTLSNTIFKISKYVLKSKQKYIGAGKYENYDIIDIL